jgi:hypothetical protein
MVTEYFGSSDITFDMYLWGFPVSIMAGTMTFLTEVFHGFPQFLQADARQIP